MSLRSYDPLLGKIVAMWWDDPYYDPDEGPPDATFQPVPKLTIGLCVHETADSVVLAHEVWLDGSKTIYGKTVLPRRVATSIQVLGGEVRGYEKKAAIKPLAQSVATPAKASPFSYVEAVAAGMRAVEPKIQKHLSEPYPASSASWSDVQSELHWRVCHDAAVWEPPEPED